MHKRDFMKLLGAAGIFGEVGYVRGAGNPAPDLKNQFGYMADWVVRHPDDIHKASMDWFTDAKFGLFLHYGLYSLMGEGAWAQYAKKIPIAEYAKLKDQFTAQKFDADFITDLALEAEMKYVNLVTKHCDSFCLWDTQHTDFNSMNSPAKRDLVGELARSCREKRLGFFAFYEHGFDWRHPHGPAPWDWDLKVVRPQYSDPDPHYAVREEYNFQNYLDYASGQIHELCTNYGPLAGVWLDGAAIPLAGDPKKFKLDELYAMIRELQPQTLISYKYGVNGKEDFLAPESGQIAEIKGYGAYAETSFERAGRPMEICMPIGSWAYRTGVKYKSVDKIWSWVERASSMNSNLLLNIGPKGDGSIPDTEVKVLRELGRRIRTEGWPDSTAFQKRSPQKEEAVDTVKELKELE